MIRLSEHAIFSALKLLSCDVKGEDAVLPSLSPEIDTGRSADIHNLVEEAELIEVVLNQFHSVVQQHIVNLRRRRNQLLPFYRLPPELVIRIIETLVYRADEYPTDFWRQDLNIPKHYSILTQLSQVSFYWRNIIVSRNLFWNKIDSRSNVHFTKLCLQRAEDAPLDIVISKEDDCRDVRDYRWMWDYCSRWRSFYFERIKNEFSMMDGRWMEAGATPLLESFHINSHPNERRRDLPPAVRSQASRLVHLGAKHFSSPTDLGSFSRLRTISFTTPQDKPLTLSQWQAFLSSTPRLRNIQIECGAFQDKMDAFTSPIHLPELRELVIIQHSLCLVDALLGAIVPAQEEYPYVTLHYCRGTTNYTRSSIYESQAFPGSILLKLREVDAIINQIKAPRGEHIYHSWRGNDKVLTFDVFYFGYVPILLIPSTGLQFLRSLEIRITIFDKASELGARICLCSALEHLVGLVSDLDLRDMGSVSSGLSNLCNLLATPLLNQPASPQLWPCPNLRYLEFDLRYSWDHFQYIKNCIETRYGVRDMDTPSPPPVFLQELRLVKWQSQLDSLSRASETSDPVGTFKEVLHSHGTELSYGR